MIEIKRNITTVVATSSKYTYSGEHMGVKQVTVNIQSPTPIDFQEGDAVVYKNNTFRLLTVPTGHKRYDNTHIEYTLTFEHEQYQLGQTLFKDVVPEGGLNEAYYNNTTDVVTIGTIDTLMGRIITNMNRLYSGWTYEIGSEVELIEKSIILNNQKCSDALALVDSLFGLQYWINGKHIRVGGTASIVGGIFEYGKDKGICEITRTGESKDVITRLAVYGANRNIPTDYNVTEDFKFNPRLMLPNFVTTGVNYIDSPLIDLNNIKEGELRNDEIFPTIDDGTGRNEIVLMDDLEEDNQGGFYLHIKDIGFNINDKLTQKSAKLSMISGLLTGVEFEIAEVLAYSDTSYPESEKKIGAAYRVQCKRDTSRDNYPLPNNTIKIIKDDRFVLLDIEMDESYILNAEARLLEWGNKQFSEQHIDEQKVSFSAKFSEEYIAANPDIESTILEGNLAHIKSLDFDIDKKITIKNLTITHDNSLFPKYDLTIADKVISSKFAAIIDDVVNVGRDLQYKISTDDISARKVTENIRSLEEDNKATVFGEAINNFIVDSNVRINNTELIATKGTIVHRGANIHYGIEDLQINKVWLIADDYTNVLDVNKKFLIYIKASKTDSSAWWTHSEAELIQDTDNFYYFEWGTIFPIDINGKRSVMSTKGITAMVGGTIYTEKTRSLNGSSYSDWENNKFIYGHNGKGIDWDVTNPDTLTTRGMVVQSPSGVSEPLGVNRGTWENNVLYYVGDRVYYDQSTYLCVTENTGNNPKTGYWQAVALKGEAFSFDQGLLSERPDPTTQAIGYAFFATDTSLLYMVIAGNPQIWNEGAPFGKGEDGTTYYTWIKYTNVLDRTLGFNGKTLGFNGKTLGLKGTPVTDNPKGAVYMGISYNNEEPTESLNQADYSWTRIKGETGSDGLDGDYFEYRYAVNGSTIIPPSLNTTDRNPVGWTTTKPIAYELMIIWSTKVKISGVTGNLVGSWESPLMEEKGIGNNISLINAGDWVSTNQYIGGTGGVIAVAYNERFYWTRVDAGAIPVGNLPLDTRYWNPFGSQAFSMATNLLLAQKATIKNLQIEAAEITGKLKAEQIDVATINANDMNVEDLVVKKLRTGTEGSRLNINDEEPNAIVVRNKIGDREGFFGEKVGVSGNRITGLETAEIAITNLEGKKPIYIDRDGLYTSAIRIWDGDIPKIGINTTITINKTQLIFVGGILIKKIDLDV